MAKMRVSSDGRGGVLARVEDGAECGAAEQELLEAIGGGDLLWRPSPDAPFMPVRDDLPASPNPALDQQAASARRIAVALRRLAAAMEMADPLYDNRGGSPLGSSLGRMRRR